MQYNVKCKRLVKSLGVGLGAGRRRNTQLQVKRLSVFNAQRKRYRALKRSGVSATKVLRTGGTAGMTYGQAVTGVSSHTLHQQRRAVAAAATADTSGKDIDLVLASVEPRPCKSHIDPAFPAHIAPLRAWAEAVWRRLFPIKMLDVAIASARLRLARALRPWAAVHGPAAAAVATAARIDWSFVDAATIRTHDGRVLRLDTDPPVVISRRVEAAVERWRANRLERTYPHLESGGAAAGAYLAPVANLMHRNAATEAWGPRQRAALRSAVVRGQWPQHRLCIARLATSPVCKFCEHDHGEDEDDVGAEAVSIPSGTEFHRVYECRPNLQIVRAHLIAAGAHDVLEGLLEVRRQAQAAAAAAADDATAIPALVAWTRALLPSPLPQVPARPAEGTWHWHVQPTQFPVDGKVYSDASLLDGPDPVIERFGWAFIIASRDPPHGILAAAFGIPPDWIDNMNGAEAWAIFMATSVADPFASYTTDSLECVRTLARGCKWATAAERCNARVWGMLFVVFDSTDDQHRLRWMPSHRSAANASAYHCSDGSQLTPVDVRLNAIADVLAKRGAATGRVPEPVRAAVQRARDATAWIAKAVGFATWAANNAPSSPHRDAQPDNGWRRTHGRQRRRRPARVQRDPRPVELGGHRLMRAQGRWSCVTCRARSVHWGRIAPSRCPGAAAETWAQRARALARTSEEDIGGGTDGAGHIRFLSDRTTWCDRCGAYADAFAVGLARECPGRPCSDGKHQHLRRLRRGCHPVTNAPFQAAPIPEPIFGSRQKPVPPPSPRRTVEIWGSGGQHPPARAVRTGARRSNEQAPASGTARPASAARRRIDALESRVRGRLAAPSIGATDAGGGSVIGRGDTDYDGTSAAACAVASAVSPAADVLTRAVRRRITSCADDVVAVQRGLCQVLEQADAPPNVASGDTEPPPRAACTVDRADDGHRSGPCERRECGREEPPPCSKRQKVVVEPIGSGRGDLPVRRGADDEGCSIYLGRAIVVRKRPRSPEYERDEDDPRRRPAPHGDGGRPGQSTNGREPPATPLTAGGPVSGDASVNTRAQLLAALRASTESAASDAKVSMHESREPAEAIGEVRRQRPREPPGGARGHRKRSPPSLSPCELHRRQRRQDGKFQVMNDRNRDHDSPCLSRGTISHPQTSEARGTSHDGGARWSSEDGPHLADDGGDRPWCRPAAAVRRRSDDYARRRQLLASLSVPSHLPACPPGESRGGAPPFTDDCDGHRPG